MMKLLFEITYGLALCIGSAAILLLAGIAIGKLLKNLRIATEIETELAPEAEQDRRVPIGWHNGNHFDI
jgi:hypothetical protein